VRPTCGEAGNGPRVLANSEGRQELQGVKERSDLRSCFLFSQLHKISDDTPSMTVSAASKQYDRNLQGKREGGMLATGSPRASCPLSVTVGFLLSVHYCQSVAATLSLALAVRHDKSTSARWQPYRATDSPGASRSFWDFETRVLLRV
jgi:hypothetical protein